MTVGLAATLVVLAHDWSEPVTRERSYPARVLPSETGREQRVSLSGQPTDRITYRLLAANWYDAETLALLAQMATDAWVRMPRWEDQTRLDTAAAAGDSSLVCDTTDRPTFVDGAQALLWRSPQLTEVVTIDTVSSGGVTLAGTLAGSWGAGTILAPITPCRVVLPCDLTQWGSTTTGALTFGVELTLADIAGVGSGGSSTTTSATAIAVSSPSVGAAGRAPIYATVTDASGLVLPGDGIVWSTDDATNAPVTNTGDPAIAMVANPNGTSGTATITATLGAVVGSASAFLKG